MIQLKSRDNADAVDMIDLLSQNIQTVFKNTRNKKSYHTLAEEFRLVHNYLQIQKYRFTDQLDFELPNEEKIAELNTISLPLMSLQIHCENAVEHGIRNQKQGGKVSIRLENDTERYVHIIVEDNGIGRKKAHSIRSKGNQQGVKMLLEMAEITNRFNADKITYRYEDDIFTTTEGVRFGTRVHLLFPITYNYEPSE
jgi:sensor histidine kinase YesM